MPRKRKNLPPSTPVSWRFTPDNQQLFVYAEPPDGGARQWVGTVVLDHFPSPDLAHKIAKRVFLATYNLGLN